VADGRRLKPSSGKLNSCSLINYFSCSNNSGATRCYERWLQRWAEHLRQIRSTVGAANVSATRCSERLIQKVWYKRLSGLSRVGDIMEDADVAGTAVAANFAFKSYGADKDIQT
jgi:hypothetical protein